MPNRRWTTTEEVLEDLAEVTGFSVVDDDYIIRGTRPPPPRRDLEIDEEEIRLRYGAEGDLHTTFTEEKLEPDLVGIAQMLRMVEESAESENQRMDWRRNLSSNPFGEGLVIEKRRPLAPAAPQNWRERKSPRSDNNRLENPPPGFNWSDRKSPNSNTPLEHTSPGFLSPKTATDKLAPNNLSSKLNPDVPIFIPKSFKPNITPVIERSEIQTVGDKIQAQMLKKKIIEASEIQTDGDKIQAEMLKKKIIEASEIQTDGDKIQTEMLKKKIIEASEIQTDGDKIQAEMLKKKIIVASEIQTNGDKIQAEMLKKKIIEASEIQTDGDKIQAEMLKKKIIEASRADKKREKNVAMAALLRLKSTSRPSDPGSSKTSPKRSVVSSEAQSPVTMKEQGVASAMAPSPVQISKVICNIAQDESAKTFAPIEPSTSDSSNNVVLFTPEYYEMVKPNVEVESRTENTSPVNPELTKRVIDWIDDVKSESPSPKTVKSPIKPQLFTKPFGFVKKQTVKSPVSVPQSNIKFAEPIPCFVPTKNASKLAEQYEKAMRDDVTPPPVQNNGFLTEAIIQKLKSRDEEFKKRKEQNAREDASPSFNRGRC